MNVLASAKDKWKKEGIWIEKEKINLSLFTNSMITHLENPKEITKKKKKPAGINMKV